MTVVKQVDNQQELDDYLNGRVLGSPLKSKVHGLDGLTLIINNGGDQTVTFSDTDGVGLSPKQILDKIVADVPALANHVGLRNYNHSTSYLSAALQIVLLTATYFVKGTGTANTILGFLAVDQTVTPIPQANIVSILPASGPGGMFVVVHV